ncbi:MAG: YtxH domain-containing protein [Bacteroidota bacterium]
MKWIIGLAAGAAAVYFLRTEKGKQLVEDVKKEAESVGDSLYALAEGLFKKGTSLAGKAAEQANSIV